MNSNHRWRMEFSLAKIQGSYTSCSCSRLVWCMHKTIKIIVEATSGDRLTAFYPRLGSWWLAERKAGGSRRDKEGKREGSSYPITLKTIVLSARGGPFWPAHSSHAFLKRGVALPPEHRGATSDDAQLWLAKSITREKVAGNTRRIEWILQTFPLSFPSTVARLRNERVRWGDVENWSRKVGGEEIENLRCWCYFDWFVEHLIIVLQLLFQLFQ